MDSWRRAQQNGKTNQKAGGQYYWDPAVHLFWTWDTPELIGRKFEDIVAPEKLGGVMAWSLGEDSYDWSHVEAMQRGVRALEV
jgi:chitinase